MALAEALVAKGVRTLFVTRTREALRLDWPCPVQVGTPPSAKAHVYDLHDWGAKDGAANVLTFEDYGGLTTGAWAAIDPHFGAAARHGDRIQAGFLGPKWAPLREPFGRQFLPAQNKSGVFVYGDAPALPKGAPKPVRYAGFNARHAAHAMTMSTLALVPPSMIALECLAVGTPVVLYVPGPKWQPIADAMVQAGVAAIWDGKDATLGRILADDRERKRMSDAGREAVDGRGADRLAEWLADA